MWQLRLINSGGTSYGGQSPVAYFGLGDANNVVTLRIEWSSGIVQEIQNVPANQYLDRHRTAEAPYGSPGRTPRALPDFLSHMGQKIYRETSRLPRFFEVLLLLAWRSACESDKKIFGTPS
jgi:hypothetical protein